MAKNKKIRIMEKQQFYYISKKIVLLSLACMLTLAMLMTWKEFSFGQAEKDFAFRAIEGYFYLTMLAYGQIIKSVIGYNYYSFIGVGSNNCSYQEWKYSNRAGCVPTYHIIINNEECKDYDSLSGMGGYYVNNLEYRNRLVPVYIYEITGAEISEKEAGFSNQTADTTLQSTCEHYSTYCENVSIGVMDSTGCMLNGNSMLIMLLVGIILLAIKWLFKNRQGKYQYHSVKRSFRKGKIYGERSVTCFHAEQQSCFQLNLSKDDLEIGFFEKISLANVQGQIGIGNDQFNIGIKGAVNVATTTGFIGCKFNPKTDTFLTGIELGVALISGSIGVQVTIFGIPLEIGVQAEIGIKATWNVQIKNGILEIKAGVTVGGGYAVYFRINLLTPYKKTCALCNSIINKILYAFFLLCGFYAFSIDKLCVFSVIEKICIKTVKKLIYIYQLKKLKNFYKGFNDIVYRADAQIMGCAPMDIWNWRAFWKGVRLVILSVVMTVNLSTLIALTAGIFASLLGVGFVIIGNIVASILTCGIASGIISMLGQGFSKGFDNINIGTVAIDTFSGAIYGVFGILGTSAGLCAKITAGTGKIGNGIMKTMLHDLNDGKDIKKIGQEIGKSLLGKLLFQMLFTAGIELFSKLGGVNNKFIGKLLSTSAGHFFQNIATNIMSIPAYKLAFIKVMEGIWNWIKGKYIRFK